ncbi:MAG: hypothetical protein QY325_04265 [Flavobacteriales bacterium]|nr:MAG: hypothetical protein QY325_04265 [Flavobacteriales bacterium]
MNDRISIELFEAPELPTCDVVVVNSRGADNPWFVACCETVRAQTHPGTRLLVVDNNDHGLSIGAAWNLAADASSATYMLMVGDDDLIMPDLVHTLVMSMEALRRRPGGEELVQLQSPMTAIDINGRVMCLLEQGHSGLWLREYVARERFNEALERHVAPELQQRMDLRSSLDLKLRHASIGHHYGYRYRQHPGMVSGMKVSYQEPAPTGITVVK